MKAFVTSIGEKTTELCVWSLQRQGFEVVLIQNDSTFNEKLRQIYNQADDDFIRVDADVIINRNIHRLIKECPKDIWWWQSLSFDWLRQDIGYAGAQYIKRTCIPVLRSNIDKAQRIDRPESQMYRLPEFHNPRRCEGTNIVCGLHGWGQDDYDRVYKQKAYRNQLDNYDFEMVEKLK